jgi:SNF family Na+-dependent transporter
MLEQTIFYILGSLFFALSIGILVVIAYYLTKLLKDISSIGENLESVVNTLKEKVEGLTGVIATAIAVIEKFKSDKKSK